MVDSLGSVSDVWEKWGTDLLSYATVLVGPDEAEDVVAESLVRLMAVESHLVDGGLLTLGYVRRVVLNEVRMRYRSRTRRERRELALSAPLDHHELLSDPAVVTAVGRLSVMQRAVVYLTYWHDLTAESAAQELGVSTGTVKRHLARARQTLRKALS